ncbi:sensor histidine kinase [Euzebya rosea]|uniref:sensor histidine kinase n=1 Tax=Euzebya rosea TaxID=2052804 RepID=UPI000D3E39CC|nr:ATP-binding protein [Euzebya rosea]
MLRRTRYLLPLAMMLAALVGAAGRSAMWWVVPLLGLAGLGLDALLLRISEERLRGVADQVVKFASDVEQPQTLTAEGGREWQRLVQALNDVATVLRDRFESLRDERERVQRVLDAIPASVMLFTDGVLAYANPAARDTFALPEDLVDLTPMRALGVAGLAEAVREVLETDRVVDVSVTRNGRELEANLSRIAVNEVAIVVTDLTDIRRVEHMRRDFVANASHELKTPVTGMQALADSLTMAMERDPERARTMAERVQLEATRLAQLVRDLLDLTRLEEGVDGRGQRRVDVTELAEAQVERARETAEARGIRLAFDATPDVSVIGYPEDLKVIIGNLVLNAIQYNRDGGRVEVKVRRRASEVMVRVTDTGIGIPEADQDRVFERFYRVDKARSRAAGGTGLGLALVRHAVERHKGKVRVSSVLGEGSTFTVMLPVDGGTSEG